MQQRTANAIANTIIYMWETERRAGCQSELW
jgi:hypothetical protein